MSGVQLDMEALGSVTDGEAIESAPQPLVSGYRAWIESQRDGLDTLASVQDIGKA